jgi:NAD(P)H-dependent FMN reductase
MDNPSKKIKELSSKIKSSDGYVSITPEYNRGISGALQNILVYF